MGKLLFSNDGIGNAPRILERNLAKNGLSFFCGSRCLRFRGHSMGPTPLFFFFLGGGDQKLMLKCCFKLNLEGFPYDLRIQFGFMSYKK